MTEWIVRFHPDFFKDFDRLSKKEIEIFEDKKNKIKTNPVRMKHLSGGNNCYREPITDNVRLVYLLKGDVIWMLAIAKHAVAYTQYLKRLQSLKEKYGLI